MDINQDGLRLYAGTVSFVRIFICHVKYQQSNSSLNIADRNHKLLNNMPSYRVFLK